MLAMRYLFLLHVKIIDPGALPRGLVTLKA